MTPLTYQLTPLTNTMVRFSVFEKTEAMDIYQASEHLQKILVTPEQDQAIFTDTVIIRAQFIGTATITKISEARPRLFNETGLHQAVWHKKNPITIKKWEELLKYCLEANNTHSISNSEWSDHMRTMEWSIPSFSEKSDFKDKNNS